MNDITEVISRYRETARHLWNSTFQFLENPHGEFYSVDEQLFTSLVLSQVKPWIDPEHELTGEYYWPSIELMPEFGPNGVRVMYSFELRGGSWQWKEIQLTSKAIKLNFMYFFDRAESEHREFQYARARVLECAEHKNIAGADLLVEAHRCKFYRV